MATVEELIWGALNNARSVARGESLAKEDIELETAAQEMPGAIAAAHLIETARLADAVESLTEALDRLTATVSYMT